MKVDNALLEFMVTYRIGEGFHDFDLKLCWTPRINGACKGSYALILIDFSMEFDTLLAPFTTYV